MKAKFTEIEVLEELAAADSPTIEGSAWITLQVIEHVLNSIFERDNLNNKYMSGLLSDTLEKYEEILLNKDSIRPIPNDTVQQMIGYTENIVNHLLNKPKGKMIKVDAMVPSYKLKNVGNKTMSWIGKQPGRTVKDKLAGKNKVLTQVNEFSYDIKENQVLSMILKEMKKLISSRINIGVNSESYDVSEEDCIRFDQMESYLKLERKYNKSKLAEVMPKVVIQPNNALISDKYYSKVWRAYQQILEYKKKVEKNWHNILERYTNCVYLSLVAEISTVNTFRLINQVNLISDEDGIINVKKLINTTFESETSAEFIVMPNNDNKTKGKIDFINKEKGYALVYINNIKHFLSRSNLKDTDKGKFDKLDRYQEIYFTVKENDSTIIKSIQTEEEIYFLKVKLVNNCISINLDRKIYNKDSSSYIDEDNTILTYQFTIMENTNLVKGRGLNFNVSKYTNHTLNNKWQFTCYGDLKGIRGTRNTIIAEILSLSGISKTKSDEKKTNQDIDTSECWVLDFIGDNCILVDSHNRDINTKKKLYALQVKEDETKKVYISKKSSGESSNSEIVSMNDLIFTNNLNQVDVIDGFDSILNSIKAEIQYQPDKYLVYTIPDSVDEFSQISMKRLFRVNFEKSFPVWRSVAAATSCKDKLILNNESKVLVIDCNGESTSSVLMEAKYNNELHDIIFERFAPYDCSDDNNPVNIKYFIKEYLDRFIAKYNIVLDDSNKEYLIKTGIIEDVIVNKEESVHSISMKDKSRIYYKFFYDEYLYNEIYNDVIENFKEYINSLKDSIGKNHISQIVLIGEYFKVSEKLRNLLNAVFTNSRYYVVRNREIVTGAIDIQKRLVAGLPTWYEHLPDLSLEVVKNGHYDKIDLIKNKSIENVMGREQTFKVSEILTLEAGKKEFKFPLLKGTSGKTNKEFNAIIIDKSFPLKEQMDVQLTIKYIYGNDNSYELIVEPVNKKENNINYIVAEWIEENDNQKENSYPHFAPTILSELDVDALEKCLDRIERLFENKFKYGVIESDSIVYAKKQVFNAMVKLQKLIYSDNHEALKIINNMKTRPLIKYLGMIIGIIPDTGVVENLEKVNSNETKFLRSTVAEFLCCFGNMIIPSVKKYIISNNESYKASALGKMIFLNGNDIEILKEFEQSFKTDSNHIIRSSGKSIWSDKSLIFDLYKNKPRLIDDILNTIEYRLKIMSRIDNPKSPLFKDFCEMLLAILRLREIEECAILTAGQVRAIRLSKYIKVIDCNISKNNGSVRSFIKFDLNKPESLSNMSDLAYVLNVYLTGEEGANLIQVKDID